MIITIDDIRSAGFCVSGTRRWFETNNIPFNDFLKNGMDADEFVERGDELAKIVVDSKKASTNG